VPSLSYLRPRRCGPFAAAALASAALAAPSQAAITVSPVMDPNNGFPFSYVDANGLGLTLCMDGSGNCFVATPAPNPAAPLPDSFTPDGEAFYFDADATMPNAGTGVIRFAQEAAFVNAAGNIVAGDQGVFNRVRFRFQTLQPGATYLVSHPWGTNEVTADGAGIVNETTDVGCVPGTPPPCDFALSTTGAVNQWVSAVSPAPPAGYVGSFARLQTITAGPSGLNFVKLEKLSGPGGVPVATVGQVDQFNLSGKIAGAAPAPAASIGISTKALSFAKREAGTTSPTQAVTVTNFGTAPGSVTGITVTGPDAADFVAAANTCTGALAPNASCTTNVAFAPTAGGDRTATLNIANDAAAGTRTIALAGSALPAPSTTTVIVAAPSVAAPSIAAPTAAPTIAPAVQPKLRLDALTVSSRMSLRSVRRRGLSAVIFAPEGAKVVKVGLLRNGRLIARTVRKTTADGVMTVVLPRTKTARRALRRGTYQLQVTPGGSATSYGVTSTRTIRVR